MSIDFRKFLKPLLTASLVAGGTIGVVQSSMTFTEMRLNKTLDHTSVAALMAVASASVLGLSVGLRKGLVDQLNYTERKYKMLQGILADEQTYMEFGEQLFDWPKRASNLFIELYDTNKGLIHLSEYCIKTGLPKDMAETFLNQLAETQEGRRMEMDGKTFYAFPHNDSTLAELNNRATAWAHSQVQALQVENQAMKAQLQNLVQNNFQEQPRVSPQPTWGNIKPPQRPEVTNPNEGMDPWGSLL